MSLCQRARAAARGPPPRPRPPCTSRPHSASFPSASPLQPGSRRLPGQHAQVFGDPFVGRRRCGERGGRCGAGAGAGGLPARAGGKHRRAERARAGGGGARRGCVRAGERGRERGKARARKLADGGGGQLLFTGAFSPHSPGRDRPVRAGEEATRMAVSLLLSRARGRRERKRRARTGAAVFGCESLSALSRPTPPLTPLAPSSSRPGPGAASSAEYAHALLPGRPGPCDLWRRAWPSDDPTTADVKEWRQGAETKKRERMR